MIELDNEASYSEEQITDESNQILTEYLDNIESQIISINKTESETDFLKELFINFFNQKDLDSVFDRSILIDPNFSEYDKDALKATTMKLHNMFENGMGISMVDKDICFYYYLYDIFVLHFHMYFTIYLNGLQKLTEDFDEEIPNWDKLSYKYFVEKNNSNTTGGESTPPAVTELVDRYLNYIITDGIIPDQFFEICLLESGTSESLSELVVENTSQRIVFDYEFFRLKIEKILSLEEVRSIIKTNIVDTIVNVSPSVGVVANNS